MESITPTREDAFALLTKYNRSESLIKHALVIAASKKSTSMPAAAGARESRSH